MTPRETLKLARARGISIEVVGDKLRIAPAAAVDPLLRDALTLHKMKLLQMLAGPRLDEERRPLDQCATCGCPTWWQTNSQEWHCDYCEPRPRPFLQGRVVVTAGGEWLVH
jgi:hypothetical protein